VSAVAVAAGVSAAGLPGAAVALVASCTVAAALTSTFERPRWPRPRSEGLDAVAPVVDGSVRAVPTLRSVGIAIAACVAAALVWMLIGSLGGLGVWLAVAGLVAVALHRLVAMIERRARAPRSVAVGIVCCVSITVVAGALALGIGGGVSSSQRLSEGLPAAVTDMEDLPVVGGFLREREAGVWLSAQMEDLPQRLQDSGSADEWLPAVGARLLDLWWVVVLAAALLVDGGSVVAGALRRVPVRWRRQAIRLTDASHAAVAGYLAGAVLVAGINATVVLTLALLTGIALAPVLAVWAFMWNFVPQIGGFMGGFPLVLLALAEGPMAALLAGTAFVAYQFLENHLIQPTVISEAIDIPAWMALLAALAGGAAAGVVGAVVLTPLVGVIRVIITQLRRDDFPGATANADRPPLAVLP
jgi:predicted PurR-regulated permease PerM